MNLHRVESVLTAALECSIYHSPVDPGLTLNELFEVGTRLGCERGEMEDGFRSVCAGYYGQPRVQPESVRLTLLSHFDGQMEPDYRSLAAFEFVHTEMKAVVRSQGASSGTMERSVLVERAAAKGIARSAVEIAITISRLCSILSENNGMLRYVQGKEAWPLPSQQREQVKGRLPPVRHSETRRAAYEIVGDVISRRSDGRPMAAEPLAAFGEALTSLGYGHFRLWWTQQVSELALTETHSTPVAKCVLAASLVEGVLTFVVKHARTLGLGVFGSRDFDREPQHWRIDDLVKSAAHGGSDAILDNEARLRAEGLIRRRQRIHAGRMLADHPSGVPDLRPEEARDARDVADMVVRRVLDWLEKHPVR